MWTEEPVSFVEGPVAVRVPATSANLGPGFDVLGLALLLPPVRALVAPAVLRRAARRHDITVVRITGTRPWPPASGPGSGRGGTRNGVIDTGARVDPPEEPPRRALPSERP